jgi:flagellar hook-associated protein 1 FlgK
LEKLEAIINEPSETGIRTVIDNFWNAWSDLAKDPENLTGRKIVRETAMALADAFNLVSRQLNDLSNDLTENINVKTVQINSILSAISNLNIEIRRLEGLGDNANDLRDRRDLLTDQLARLVNISVQETETGYTINMGETQLVNGGTAAQLSAADLEGAFESGALEGGEIYGLIISRDRYVADYQRQLDAMARAIAEGEITVTIPAGSVLPNGIVLNGVTYNDTNRFLTQDLTVTVNGLNGLHQLGYPLVSPLETGLPFFVSKDGGPITAGSFTLNPQLADDPGKIATSLRTEIENGTETVIKGNNTLALLISNLKFTHFNFGTGTVLNSGTLNDYFQSLVGQLGVQSSEAIRQSENQEIILDQIENRRMSVSSVSLDEEMANMIKFQHAYNASARVMTAIDEMLDRIINGMGVVGR